MQTDGNGQHIVWRRHEIVEASFEADVALGAR